MKQTTLFPVISLLIFLAKAHAAKEYDFIIIGAGSAGSVLAGRLSEDPKVQVLLLEAGGHETIINEIPLAATATFGTKQDWQYVIEPQTNASVGFQGQVIRWPRGKVLGGSSAINAMMYVRGNRRDYDHWSSLGNYGWSYDEVLPYFKKSEGLEEPQTANLNYHGTSGPLTVSAPKYWTKSASAFLEGANENGIPVRDINGKIQTGSTPLQATIRNGRRCSAYKAYVKPVKKRRNLHIRAHAFVLKILINENGAYGVKYSRHHVTHEAKATKEVLLSAGAINSPQILMLSGVGPKRHLESLGIPVIADVPGVGRNLHDHPSLMTLPFTLKKHAGIIKSDLLNPVNILEYILYGRGLLSSPIAVEATLFFKTKYANQTDDWPDVQMFYLSYSSSNSVTKTLKYQPKTGKNVVLIIPVLLRPKSRGYIKLRTTNPYDHPIIQPNYLSEEDDVATLAEGLKMAVAIGNSNAFRKYGSKFLPIDKAVPGCPAYDFNSNDYWQCLTRYFTNTAFHPVGTVKMGPPNNPMAVVNPELEVHKVKGLRVIDASIMPYIVSGNLNAPVIMIAEKAADLIKAKWKLTSDN